jgi:hypothetical protein
MSTLPAMPDPTYPQFATIMESIWEGDNATRERWANARETAKNYGARIEKGQSSRGGKHGYLYKFENGLRIFISQDGTMVAEASAVVYRRGGAASPHNPSQRIAPLRGATNKVSLSSQRIRSLPMQSPTSRRKTLIIVLPARADVAPTILVVSDELAAQLYCQGKILLDETSLEYWVEASQLPQELRQGAPR